jgi:tetratricopeptide (TPR) repeat protein
VHGPLGPCFAPVIPVAHHLLCLALLQSGFLPSLTETSATHAVLVAVDANAERPGSPAATTLSWIDERVRQGRPDEVCRWIESCGELAELPGEVLEAAGRAALEAEHAVLARTLYRALLAQHPREPRGLLGLGRAWLLLGRGFEATRYGEAAVAERPFHSETQELQVRALLLSGQYEEALRRAERALFLIERPSAGLLSAHGSALFRMRRHTEAAAAYRRALAIDPMVAEASLKLGSGLAEPGEAAPLPGIEQVMTFLERREFTPALAILRKDLGDRPGHPVALRLLGETLLDQKLQGAWFQHDPDAPPLLWELPAERVDPEVLGRFFPDFAGLSPSRQKIVLRAAGLFWPDLERVDKLGGSHDIVASQARTTDSGRRESLRGRLTFDGRLWDDVRGVGGLNAATGIEALDGPGTFCFDTMAHEVAHQVHLFGFTQHERIQVKRLYERALREGRTLDYYAASNDTEYFAQGVEAFVALGKRPGRQVTHGHTRFELFRRDPELHAFLARKVAFDPLRDRPAPERDALLRHAVRFALRCGRTADAETAAGWLAADGGGLREAARAAAMADRSH